MSYIIKNIPLDSNFSDYDVLSENTPQEKILPNLSKINIFVGANNSGKSRFMRLLASTKELRFTPNFDFKELNDLKKETEKIIHNYSVEKRYSEINGLVQDSKSLSEYKFIVESSSYLDDILNIYKRIFETTHLDYAINNTTYSNRDTSTSNDLKRLLSSSKEKLDTLIEKFPKTISFKKLYIPTLRGLRTFPRGNDYDPDCYFTRTVDDYFKDKLSAQEVGNLIFTGLKLYDKIKDLLLGNLAERETVAQFQNFLSETFFDNKPVALIPRKDSNVLFVKIGNEDEFPIYNLGDGIQSIIVTTFPLFERKNDNLLVFIEEPEIYMHPGLQRIFLNTLLNFDSHQFFFTTHSNHFLDITLDYNLISVYTFKKELQDKGEKTLSAKFEIQNISNENNNTLELLGVKNSSVFLTNCTIWVEGITDRKYIAHYLVKYQESLAKQTGESNPKTFNEDLHYSFVEYSGANITHWSFLGEKGSIEVERLCSKLFLISDKDDPEDKTKSKRRQKLKERLGKRFYCLKCREVENLLTPDVLKKVIKEYGEDISNIPDIKFKDYQDKYLGTFIEKNILKGKRTRNGSYSTGSGTITQKLSFCEKALKYIEKFEDLSDEAKRLTKLIYEFIKENNR
jgi:predicted ATP-dependent endonuclease of OLD family